MKLFSKMMAVVAVGLSLLAGHAAHAGVVQFTGSPSTSWADGTFTTGLSGIHPDGFFFYTGPTSAYNGYGQNNEKIFFNAPVQLNALNVQQYSGVQNFTAILYNTLNVIVESQTISLLDGALHALTFNTNDVSSIEFVFTGGSNVYGDGRMAAWYILSNVTYSANVASNVPAPGALALLGLGLFGIGAARRTMKTA